MRRDRRFRDAAAYLRSARRGNSRLPHHHDWRLPDDMGRGTAGQSRGMGARLSRRRLPRYMNRARSRQGRHVGRCGRDGH